LSRLRPGSSCPPIARSPIELTAFDESLGAARSGVVDVTSVDYRSLDHNLTEIENATTGALRDEVLATLNERRDRLVADQQVSSTEVTLELIEGRWLLSGLTGR